MIGSMKRLYSPLISALVVLVLVSCSGLAAMENDVGPQAVSAPAFAMSEAAMVEPSPPMASDALVRDGARGIAGAPAPQPVAAAAKVASAPADETTAQLVSQQRIIVRTIDMRMQVGEVASSLDAIAALAVEMDGFVVSSNRSRKHSAFVSFRVPAERLDEAVLRLRDMAVEVEREDRSSQDVTEEYFDARARLGSLEAERDAYQELFKSANQVEDALKVRQALTQVQGEIEVLQGRINLLERTSALSLINVVLELESQEMTVDVGEDQTAGVGNIVRLRAFFRPPEGIENFHYTWDFGDGSGLFSGDRTAPTSDEGVRVTATVSHEYRDERDSPYFAEIKITGDGETGAVEGEATLEVTVTRLPSIEVFAGESITTEEDQEVEFVGSFTRPAGLTNVNFKWDFGDGSAPGTGVVSEGATNAVATHVYPDHRPFQFAATLTITADSEAGKVEAASSVGVRVTESRGWVVAGWSLEEQGKNAVRALSAAVLWAGTAALWALILSPIWGAVGFAVVLTRRRMVAGRRSRLPEDQTAPAAGGDAAQVEE